MANHSNQHFKRLLLLQGFCGRLSIGLIIMLVTIVIQLIYPKALAYFIDNLKRNLDPEWFSYFALFMLALITVQAVATALRYYYFESTGLMIVAKIRCLVHRALICQPISFYDKHSTGELTNRLYADVEVLQDTLTTGLAVSLRSVLIFIGATVMLLVISPLLSIGILLFVPVSLFLSRWMGRKIRKLAEDIQERYANCGKVANENFTNIRLVHGFNQLDKAQQQYSEATSHAIALSLTSSRFLASFNGLFSFALYTALLATLWLGGQLIMRGALTVGELTSFVLYAGMVAVSASSVSGFWGDWMKTMGATDRVFQMISTAKEPMRTAGSVKLSGNIELVNLEFRYPQRPEQAALSNFNLSIYKGQKVALIGASGAGKSTIANLILGFYKAQRGEILFDGVNSKELPLAQIRQGIAIVEQEPALFSGTILDNILYALPDGMANAEDAVKAAELANAHQFIQKLPHQYNTLVGERGVQLSGGQKQRIAIARALLRDPAILILDEATSALDSTSELLVQAALNKLMAGRTALIIAHRYSTIAKADQIVVLDKGKVVQTGSHAELQQDTAGVYFQLMHSQITQQTIAV